MKLHVVLQTAGLTGLAIGAFILWGVGVAVLTGSAELVAAGVVRELERNR